MGDTVTVLSGLLLAVFTTILLKLLRSYSVKPPYPPGPEQSLLSGNIRIIPAEKAWCTYTSWAKIYGGVVHFKEFTQHVVVVNTVEDGIALFEKRSQIYSDRPVVTMVELMGWDFNAALVPYSDKWRRHRRIYQQNFKKEVAVNYQPTQTRKVHEMLHKLLITPENFMLHYRTAAAAIVMATMYDNKISPADVDRFVTVAEQAVGKLSETFTPGALLVNALPFLRHLPSWFPGAGFKRFAELCKVYTDEMQDVPFNFVKERMAAGVEISGLTADLLRHNNDRGPTAGSEEDIKGVTATAFAAGADTTVSSLGTFFYGMLVNPDAQRKAQEEIDRVIGTRRLPDYDDRGNLPYVEAIYREVMRWQPVTPLGVPHGASADDVYNGYYIPKGTTVMSNIWAMTHDEAKYPQPDSFIPERFLDKNGELNDDDQILTFGFGRRICPGRHMASATIWLTIASVVATFNITKAKDADGNDISVDDAYFGSLIIHKVPYRNVITPRSKEARELILEAHDENLIFDGPSKPNVLT